jgi:hypothetical protein
MKPTEEKIQTEETIQIPEVKTEPKDELTEKEQDKVSGGRSSWGY